jgi:hypothetical protein
VPIADLRRLRRERGLPLGLMTEDSDNQSFGVFKPVGHVVVSFANAALAEGAGKALKDSGLARDASLRAISDSGMTAQADTDIAQATPLASLGQELNLVKAHRELALLGYHFLVVKADDNEHASRIADVVRKYGAERAQHYGHFIVEELIEHATDTVQYADTPDRGLDARTPSGLESERATLRPNPKPQLD